MKIIRFRSEKGEIYQGVLVGERAAEVRLLEGDIFSRYGITDTVLSLGNLLAPIVPTQIYAVGLNYRRHADETGGSYPERPEVFMKAVTSVIGSGEAIRLPLAGPDQVDYEGELAIIIGREGKNLPVAEAEEHILGYCCANDVSARDWQWVKQQGQWIRAKSFDTFCPLGPALVTKDEIGNADDLRIETRLNGRRLQSSTTADMIFDVRTIVSELSRSVTLLPGTVILTGTPEGVGFTRNPPVFLAPGDEIAVEIDGLGRLVNSVAVEEA